jgi:hypothetical protein
MSDANLIPDLVRQIQELQRRVYELERRRFPANLATQSAEFWKFEPNDVSRPTLSVDENTTPALEEIDIRTPGATPYSRLILATASIGDDAVLETEGSLRLAAVGNTALAAGGTLTGDNVGGLDLHTQVGGTGIGGAGTLGVKIQDQTGLGLQIIATSATASVSASTVVLSGTTAVQLIGSVDVGGGSGACALHQAGVYTSLYFDIQVPATGPVGSIVGKVPVVNANTGGSVVGYLPIYGTIT